ncbi:MAG: galactose oxidase-like domain-containing protein [Limisphaerales bacterium]
MTCGLARVWIVVAFFALAGGPALRADTVQNFDAGGTAYDLAQNNVNPPPTVTAAGPTGNFLRLVSATAQQNVNTIAFAKSDAGTFKLITAEFDFHITGQADGMCFALLDTFTWGQAGPMDTIGEFYQEPNIAASLGIGFDIFNNFDGGDPNGNHVSIHFNGQKIQDFDAGTVNLKSGQWIHAKIIVRPGGGNSDVSVILTPNGGAPVTICTNVAVTGLQPYESRVMFGARSGGLTADHDLDNVNVKFEQPVLGTVGFGFATYATPETFPAQIYVSRYGASTGDVTINFATSNLTAIAGVDYVATNGTLTFGPNDLVKFFRVEPIDNATVQANRQLTVHLSNPGGGVSLDTQTVATVTIVDNDDPARVGSWDTPIDMPVNPYPVVPIHVNVLPSGKLVLWDRGAPFDTPFGGTDGYPYIWDMAAGTFTRTPFQGYDLFCSGHALMADGRLFVPGGHIADGVGEIKASIYDPGSNTWTRVADMNAGRWYPTVTMLGNGDLLVEAGTVDIPTDVNKTAQIWQIANGAWRNLTGAAAQHGVFPVWANYYPFMYLAPNGKVFNAGPQQMSRYLDTAGTGLWTDVAPSSLVYRDYGTSVLYDDGKIMIHGGNPPEGYTQPSIYAQTATIYPSRVTEVINLNDPTPAWRQTAQANTGRRLGTAVLLPDGKVFLCNGSSSPGFNIAAGKVLLSEMWDPATEVWTPMAPNVRYRGYHSNALLLPDGRVLATGGGHPNPPDDLAEASAEIYSPPYLFRGARPTITTAPANVTFGEKFTVTTPDAAGITNVVWIRFGNTTHNFDQNQRINRLAFSAGNGQLTVTAPSDPNLCPPGQYMLFILNTNGVPAVARTVRIGMGILAVTRFGSDNLVTVTTYPGAKYTLERVDALSGTAWTTIAAGFTATQNTALIIDAGSAGLPARFYRVRQVP